MVSQPTAATTYTHTTTNNKVPPQEGVPQFEKPRVISFNLTKSTGDLILHTPQEGAQVPQVKHGLRIHQ